MYLALRALGIGEGEGDEVITTPLTWPATANVIVRAGARPSSAMSTPTTLCLDPAAVAAAVTPRTRADHARALRRSSVRPRGDRGDLRASTACGSSRTRRTPPRRGSPTGARSARSATSRASASTPTRTSRRARAACSRLPTRRSQRASPPCACTASRATPGSATRRRARAPTTCSSRATSSTSAICTRASRWASCTGSRSTTSAASRRPSATTRASRTCPASRRSAAGSGPRASMAGTSTSCASHREEAGAGRDAYAEALGEEGIGTGLHFLPVHDLTYFRASHPTPAAAGRGGCGRRGALAAALAGSLALRRRRRRRGRAPPARALHAMTRPVRLALQIGLSVVLIAAVLWQADLHKIGNALRDSSPGWFCAAIAINVVATFVMVVRWHLLLVARGRREPGLWWLFETYVIALLLGQVLPTAVGGDAVRAIDLARRTGERAEAVSSVVVDRVVGPGGAGCAGRRRSTRRRLRHRARHGRRARPRRRRRHGRSRRALFSRRLQPPLRRARAAGGARCAPRRRCALSTRRCTPIAAIRSRSRGSSSWARSHRACAPCRSASWPRAWGSISATRRCSCSARCCSSSPSSPPRSTGSACARPRSSSCWAAPGSRARTHSRSAWRSSRSR